MDLCSAHDPEYLMLVSDDVDEWSFDSSSNVYVYTQNGRRAAVEYLKDELNPSREGYLISGHLEGGKKEAERLREEIRLSPHEENLQIFYAAAPKQISPSRNECPFDAVLDSDDQLESVIDTILDGGERHLLKRFSDLRGEFREAMDEYHSTKQDYMEGNADEEDVEEDKHDLLNSIETLEDEMQRPDMVLLDEEVKARTVDDICLAKMKIEESF